MNFLGRAMRFCFVAGGVLSALLRRLVAWMVRGSDAGETEHDAAGSAAGPGAGADDAQGGLSARRLVPTRFVAHMWRKCWRFRCARAESWCTSVRWLAGISM
jgi:hypothetical protein